METFEQAWNSLTPEQRELYDKFRQLSSERQRLMKLVITMMVDLQDTPSEARLFSLWMDSGKIHDRPVKEVIRVLRTGSWRREAAKLQSHRVLRAIPKAAGAR